MASNFYRRIAPDYRDVDNKTGGNPGFLVEVRENDAGIGVSLSAGPPEWRDFRGVFLTVDDAEGVIAALQEAVTRARAKL